MLEYNYINRITPVKSNNIKATFFVTGDDSEFGIKMYKRIIDEGHSIGNHSFTHNYSKIYRSIDSYIEDHKKLEELLIETVGVKPVIIRFPGGSNNTVSHRYGGRSLMGKLTKRMKEDGYVYFDWNVDSGDSVITEATEPKDLIIKNTLDGVKGKKEVIILFHDSKWKTTTYEALKEIIPELKKQGYRFEVLKSDSFNVQFLK